jgi:hypothetical protein
MKPLHDHIMHRLLQRQKLPMLVWLTEKADDQIIVGAKTKHAVNAIICALRQQGMSCDGIHPNRSRKQREGIFNAYHEGHIQILVSTHKYLITMPETYVSRLIFADVPHEHDYIRLLSVRPKQTVTFVTDSDLTTLHNIESIFERRLKDGFTPRRLPNLKKPSRSHKSLRSYKRKSVQIPETDKYPVPIYPIPGAVGSRRTLRSSQIA